MSSALAQLETAAAIDVRPLRAVPTAPEFDLPLSWSWANAGEPEELAAIELASGTRFIHAARLGSGTSARGLAEQLREWSKDAPVLISGLDAAQVDQLRAPGRFATSSAAIIDLPGYRPQHKVRNLVKRARPLVSVEEVDPRGEAILVQRQLEQIVRHEGRRLRYLFRAEACDSQRAFIARGENGAPHGLVALTRLGPGAWHTELIIRHPDAVAGLMELLILTVAETLEAEGARILNLGQVALCVPEEARAGLSFVNRALLTFGDFASRVCASTLKTEGLRRFKNKFATRWETTYFAGWPQVSLVDLSLVVHRAGALRL